MEKNSRILITGSSGLVGSSLVNKLKYEGYKNILTPSSKKLDLRNQYDVEKYFQKNKVEFVFHLAAKVGGTGAKLSAPAEFLYDNVIMTCNILNSSKNNNVKRLIFIGSSTVYSTKAPQPLKESILPSGELEPINEGYALAKIIGLKLCEYYNIQFKTEFIGLVACNLYGLNDNFGYHPHVIPLLILKLHKAKEDNQPFVVIRGSGKARREFLFADDVVDAILYFIRYNDMKKLKPFINIGYGKDISIKELAMIIKRIVGYNGKIKFDSTKPEGTSKRLLDIKKAAKLGWRPKIDLKDGIKRTYDWFLQNRG